MPSAAKASLDGMKTVRSGVVSTVSTRLACVRASTMPVRPASDAWADALTGSVRRESILWTIISPTWMS